MPSLIIRIYGIVQGVGFRPFVSRTADSLGIKGTVANKGSYVECHAQGEKSALEKFCHSMKADVPQRASVLAVDVRECDEKQAETFEIIESEKEEGDIFVSPDIATCDECHKELFDKNDRRYLHPFINCTSCGPRLTILDSMPYDRVRTSMGEFPMCEKCEEEYTSPETRRYDAQPVCCNECGPQVYIIGTDIKGKNAITAARKAIMNGKIIAVKGIGGFHLCCDALNENAVKRLRTLKNRPAKPFAVMMKDFNTAQRECEILKGQEEYLNGWQKPILLLKKKDTGKLCGEISPNNPTVGIMLPYAPVQMLLFDYTDEVKMTDCLVMTSGNVSGAPIAKSDEDAVNEIGSFCDLILSHNRIIRIRADDTVMDWFDSKPYMIRRSRGFAPLPVMLSKQLKGNVLAIGGELKNTFCVGKNSLLYMSPYVGDMADVRTVKALRESVKRLENLLECEATAVVCDMHPKYNTVAVAEEMCLPLMKIQHHYAHILSCMAENDYFEKCIGVSFDGTGYGLDGTVWGGEFLVCDYKGFERVGSISPFMQVGGDISAKEGWRIAVSLIRNAYGEKAFKICERLKLCDEKTFKLQAVMADKKINSVLSTSCGRLFDGASAILGIKKSSTFEGEASMSLEFEGEGFESSHLEEDKNEFYREHKHMSFTENGFEICTDNLVKYLCEGVLGGKNVKQLAYEFHSILADMIVSACGKIRHDTGLNTCALSGGVFQNRLLLSLTKQRLEKADYIVLTHSLVPPNDGGIALGQCAYALMNL